MTVVADAGPLIALAKVDALDVMRALFGKPVITAQAVHSEVVAAGLALRGVSHLLLDRDPLYTGAFRTLLRQSGVKPLRLPARSPNLNAYAERFVLSVKSECLNRLVPLGERHLRAAIREFVDHDHEERPHQGMHNDLLLPRSPSTERGPVRRRERLGGMLNFYYREAA